MTTQAEENRRRNQAEFWNERQAKATTPEARAAVWYDACRMLTRGAERRGNPQLWEELTRHLHAFFQHHAG